MALLAKYNAKDCVIQVDGVYITGVGENMVTWAKQEALFEESVGAQGDVVASEINNDIHTFTVGIQQTSPQRNFLLSLKKRKEPFPVWCTNKSMGIRFGGELALVKEVPEIAQNAHAEDMEIALLVFDGDTITD